MGALYVLSLREENHQSLLSSELKHLDIGIAALSEVRRLDCGEIMVGGYTFFFSFFSHSHKGFSRRSTT